MDIKNNWHAKWIWDAFHGQTANCYALLKKRFDIKKISDIEYIKIFCACPGEYKLYLNDNFLGRGGIPSQLEYQYYEELNINRENIEKVIKYDNTITVICHNIGVGVQYKPLSPAGFFFQMEITYIDGNVEYLVSDRSWKFKVADCWEQNSPQMFWTLGFQEIVDLDLYKKEFFECKFESQEWDYAVEIGAHPVKPWYYLIPEEIPKLKESVKTPTHMTDWGECKCEGNNHNIYNIADVIAYEEHYPLFNFKVKNLNDNQIQIIRNVKDQSELIYSKDLFIVFDFGKEIVGHPCIEFETDEEVVIDIGYSECLNIKNRVDPTRQGIKYADRLIARNGKYVWEMFSRRAFRYIQITIRSIKNYFTIRRIYVNTISYPFNRSAHFKSSNNRLNKIYDTSKYTLDICMKEVYEDCPLRERAQYIGDMRVEALMNYYAFGDEKLIAKGLRQFAREQREDGWFKSLCPGSTKHNIVDYLPLWVVALWEYYLYTADNTLLRDLYSAMIRLMEWLRQQTDDKGLLVKQSDWWIFIDWDDIHKEGIVTGLQCLYYKALVDAAKIANVVGDTSNKKQYLLEAAMVKKSINMLLWNENKGAYVDCMTEGVLSQSFSRQTNCLAVIFNIADEKRKESIKDFLNSNQTNNIKTSYFKFYEMEAQYRLKSFKEFYNNLYYWDKMQKSGATTWWEIFDDINGKGKFSEHSLCHGWSSAPLYHMPAKIAGVIPLKPGFKEFIIRPMLFGERWIEASIPTNFGDIYIKAETERSDVILNCLIPEKTTAIILIPFKNNAYEISAIVNDIILEPEVFSSSYVGYKLKGKRDCTLIISNAMCM